MKSVLTAGELWACLILCLLCFILSPLLAVAIVSVRIKVKFLSLPGITLRQLLVDTVGKKLVQSL
jgi:hypothetical protein